jgi:hypothetical protein
MIAGGPGSGRHKGFIPEFLYHGTTDRNLEGMKRLGYLYSSPDSGMRKSDDSKQRSGVYLTESPNLAASYARSATDTLGGSPVVIAIHRDKVPEVEVDPRGGTSSSLREFIVPGYHEIPVSDFHDTFHLDQYGEEDRLTGFHKSQIQQ